MVRRWWRGRGRAEAATAPGPAVGGGSGPDDRPEPPIDRLVVDGTAVPLRVELAEFERDVRARRVALLRTDFVLLSVSTADYPLFRLVEAGAGDITPASTLCCLRCSARHSLPALQAGMLLGRPPLTGCQRCGCPDAVLVYDPAARGPDAPHQLRRPTGSRRCRSG